MMERCVVRAHVSDAYAFRHKFATSPKTVAKDYDLSKDVDEHVLEFYVNVADPAEARRQFDEAVAFVGQSATVLGVYEA